MNYKENKTIKNILDYILGKTSDKNFNNLGVFIVKDVNKEIWDIDLWGNENHNKENQLTILVSDESLFDYFTEGSKWLIISEHPFNNDDIGDDIFFGLNDDGNPNGDVFSF